MAEGVLVADGVRVEAGALRVRVDGLRVARGDVVAVLGPNGAGKSTALEVFAGIRRPDAGTVERAGETSYLPQQPVLFNGTVERNVAMPLRLRRRHRDDAVTEALRAFDVGHLADRPAKALSGGEGRRAALARAIVTRPDLLLLDEPFGGLDGPTRASLLGPLGAVLRAGDPPRATVLITHDPDEVTALADTVVVMSAGRIVQSGAVPDVFARPADEEVAGLVGAENVVFGRVRGVDRGLAHVAVGDVVLEATGDVAAGDAVALLIRPEALVLSAASLDAVSARNRLRAMVTAVDRRPHHVRVSLDASGVGLVAAVVPVSVDELELRPGRQVTVSLKATAVHAVRRSVN